MIEELAKLIKEKRGFDASVQDYGTHKVLSIYFGGHKAAVIRRIEGGKLRVSSCQIKTKKSNGFYDYPKMDSIHVSEFRGLDAVFKDIDRRFLEYLEGACEPVLEELKRWDDQEDAALETICEVAKVFDCEADSRDKANKTFWYDTGNGETLEVDARYSALSVKITGLSLDQFKKIVEVLK